MRLKRSRSPGLLAAVAAAGSMSAIARHIGITPQAVAGWDKIPLERVPAVETATGVPRHVLRADYFGAQEMEASISLSE